MRTMSERMVVQERILAALDGSARFLVTYHLRPDGDALGSALAMMTWLRVRGSDAIVVSGGGVPAQYDSLTNVDAIETALPESLSGRTVVVLDTPRPERTGIEPELLRDAELVVNIDHHPDNTMFGDLNMVDAGASSTALLVHELLTAEGTPLGSDVASLLYVGVMTDTGTFRFGNTDRRTLDTAAELVGLGADPASLAGQVYGRQPAERMRLLGLVLASVESELNGRVSVMRLTEEMRAETGAEGDDIEGLASHGRLLEGVEVAVLLREEGGRVRASLRSSGRADVGEIARRMGGGGHGAAAGVVLDGPLDNARAVLVAALRESID